MIEPRCATCGGLLEALPADASLARDDTAFAVQLPALSPAFGRLLRLALLSLLVFSAARVGWSAGGAGLAIAASGVVGLFTVPLIVGE